MAVAEPVVGVGMGWAPWEMCQPELELIDKVEGPLRLWHKAYSIIIDMSDRTNGKTYNKTYLN